MSGKNQIKKTPEVELTYPGEKERIMEQIKWIYELPMSQNWTALK